MKQLILCPKGSVDRIKEIMPKASQFMTESMYEHEGHINFYSYILVPTEKMCPVPEIVRAFIEGYDCYMKTASAAVVAAENIKLRKKLESLGELKREENRRIDGSNT